MWTLTHLTLLPQLQVAESELDIYTAREQAEEKKLETLRKSWSDADELKKKKSEELAKFEEYIPQLEQETMQIKTELKDISNKEAQCEQKVSPTGTFISHLTFRKIAIWMSKNCQKQTF